MEKIKFNRFKKKSLILLYLILDDEILLRKKIKNQKLFQSIRDLYLRRGIMERKVFTDHTNSVFCLIHVKENILASGSKDDNIKLWDFKNSELLKTFSGHEGSVYELIKINDNKIASCSWDED